MAEPEGDDQPGQDRAEPDLAVRPQPEPEPVPEPEPFRAPEFAPGRADVKPEHRGYSEAIAEDPPEDLAPPVHQLPPRPGITLGTWALAAVAVVAVGGAVVHVATLDPTTGQGGLWPVGDTAGSRIHAEAQLEETLPPAAVPQRFDSVTPPARELEATRPEPPSATVVVPRPRPDLPESRPPAEVEIARRPDAAPPPSRQAAPPPQPPREAPAARRSERTESDGWSRPGVARGGDVQPAVQVDQGVSAQGDVVRSVQRHLAELGHYTGPIDGMVGPMTRGAVRAFQVGAGLQPTGQIDRAVVLALELELAAAYPRGQRPKTQRP